jgi:hypothetical protein
MITLEDVMKLDSANHIAINEADIGKLCFKNTINEDGTYSKSLVICDFNPDAGMNECICTKLLDIPTYSDGVTC